jgi:cell division protein FtsL
LSNNAIKQQTKRKRMQIEFTNLIAQANSNGNPRKASQTAATPKATSNKHIAEQFEFPFAKQFSMAKPGFTGSAK